MTTHMVAYRLTPQAIAHLDLLVTALQSRSVGRVSKADAVAWAVARAIDELAVQSEPALAAPAVSPKPAVNRRVAAKGGKIAREAEALGQRDDDRRMDMERKEQRLLNAELEAIRRAAEQSAKPMTAPKPVGSGPQASRLAEAPPEAPPVAKRVPDHPEFQNRKSITPKDPWRKHVAK